MISLISNAVSLDGEYIEDNVPGYKTLSVSGRYSDEYTISEEERPVGIDGSDYYGKRRPAKQITVTFRLYGDDTEERLERFRELKGFCKGENRIIRFKNEPDKFYSGTIQSFSAPYEGREKAKCLESSMILYCENPDAVEDIPTTVTAAANADGILTAVVENDASAKAYPVYRIKHNAENGYIGISHSDTMLELGSVEEADGTTYTQSEELATIADLIACAADTGTNYMHTAYNTGGTLKTGTHDGYTGLELNAVGSGSSSLWRGGMRTFTMPADSEGAYGAVNFYSYMNFGFETGLMGQTGEITVAFLDASNNVIAGYAIRKSDKSGNTAKFEFWANNKVLKTISFTPSYKDTENPFIVDRGDADIRKEGEKLTFYWFGKYYEYNVSAVAESVCTKIQVSFSQAPGRTKDSKYVSRCYLRRIYLKKLNVSKYRNDPNRYAEGSEVVIDTASDTITVNGMSKNEELVTGSIFAPLEPGETTIQFYKSSWCTADPTITVEFRKRWL